MKASSQVFRIRVFVISMLAFAALSTTQQPTVAEALLTRQTGPGREVLIRGFAEFDRDCNGRPADAIRVIDAPRRGRIEQRRGIVKLAADRVGDKSCADATLDGVQVYYVPDDGFVGSDRFALDVEYPDRKSIHATVEVAVEGAARNL